MSIFINCEINNYRFLFSHVFLVCINVHSFQSTSNIQYLWNFSQMHHQEKSILKLDWISFLYSNFEIEKCAKVKMQIVGDNDGLNVFATFQPLNYHFVFSKSKSKCWTIFKCLTALIKNVFQPARPIYNFASHNFVLIWNSLSLWTRFTFCMTIINFAAPLNINAKVRIQASTSLIEKRTFIICQWGCFKVKQQVINASLDIQATKEPIFCVAFKGPLVWLMILFEGLLYYSFFGSRVISTKLN